MSTTETPSLAEQLASTGPGWSYSALGEPGAANELHVAERRGTLLFREATASADRLLGVVKDAESRIAALPVGRSMNDDRVVQRLEEQLRDAHAANADLRDRVAQAERVERQANAKKAEANAAILQFEKACQKQKAAEDNAAAAQRKQADAERQLLRARGEIEELKARLERVEAEAYVLRELNARIERAKHAQDLFS